MYRFLFLIIFVAVTLLVQPVLAQKTNRWGSGIDFTQRTANREKGRWSLTEWLEMKNRNRMMDMWLSVSSPSPFEFSFLGSYNSYETKVGDSALSNSFTSYSGEFSAYAQLIGLTAEYENNTQENYNDLSGLLNIRLLGNSIQNTSFTIAYGQRAREFSGSMPGRLSQQFADGSLQIYLTKYFGIDGKYRHFMPGSSDELGHVEGSIIQTGLYLDFKAVRIFGAWYNENQKTKLPAAPSETVTDRTGVKSGIKIFF